MALPPAPRNPWRTVSRTVVYRNAWTSVVEDRLEGPDGRPGLFGYLQARPGVLVLPLFPDRTVMLIRQWRYVQECSSWEAVAGSAEAGEAPAHAARRELAEEARLSAARWTPFGELHASDSRVGGLLHCWVAEDLTPVTARCDDTEIDLARARVPLAEAIAAVEDGTITHIATAYLVLRVERWLCARDRAANSAPDAP